MELFGGVHAEFACRKEGKGGRGMSGWWNDRCFRGIFIPSELIIDPLIEVSSVATEPEAIELATLAPENRFPKRLCWEMAFFSNLGWAVSPGCMRDDELLLTGDDVPTFTFRIVAGGLRGGKVSSRKSLSTNESRMRL